MVIEEQLARARLNTMSQLGQKPPSAMASGMSAEGYKPGSQTLLDNLVCAEEEGGRDLNTEGSCRRSINDQFERRRLLNRQIARPRTF
jgi:hypothetical protein